MNKKIGKIAVISSWTITFLVALVGIWSPYAQGQLVNTTFLLIMTSGILTVLWVLTSL